MSTAAFWDRTAKKYAKTAIPNEAIYEQKLAITREYLTPQSQVLEIACGTGTTALKHAPHVQQIDAWDISEKMLAIAQQKQDDQGVSNVRFRCADISNMTLPNNHYDIAMAHSILHLLPSQPEALAVIFQSLKPGGILISSTACLGNKMNWLKFIARPMHFMGIWPEVYFFTSAELENSITEAGFKVEQSWLPKKAIAHFFVAKKPL